MSLMALFASCDVDDYNKEKPHYVRPDRHDAIPEKMIGTWASIIDKETPIVTITDSTVSMDLTKYSRGILIIPFKDLNLYTASARGDDFTIEYNGSRILMGFGTEGIYTNLLTLTIDNDCITRMAVYIPPTQQPEPQPEPEPNPEPETPVNVN